MERAKADYKDQAISIVKDTHLQPVTDIVASDQQGYASTTYFVTFSDSSPIVLQFRPKCRLLLEDNFRIARSRLRSLVPDVRFLKEIEGSILVYELTRVPGCSFNQFLKTPDFIPLLPSVAAGVGRLLGMSYVPGSRAGDDKAWSGLFEHHLQAAVDSVDPLVAANRIHYATLLSDLRAGALDDLPLSISNDDISPTNLIVSLQGTVTGLVDWEDVCEWPIGYENKAIFWLMGTGWEEGYTRYDNANLIAECFWTAFGSCLPDNVRIQSAAMQSAMKIGAALSTSMGGTYNAGHLASLQYMLAYKIPPGFFDL